MKLLLILIFHPSHIVKSRDRVHPLLLHTAVLGYVVAVGYAFQFLFPRLLNQIPWFGFLRLLFPGNWNPGFSEELFLRGSAMAALVFGLYVLVYWLGSFVTPGRAKSPMACYLAGLATCIPILITCGAAIFAQPFHELFALLPAYGLFASTCLHVILLKDLYGFSRPVTIYLAPLVLGTQLCGSYLLLP
ncbi:MAG: hypothetical protein AB3N33_08950 [Puniceicoccaceae bacterium]